VACPRDNNAFHACDHLAHVLSAEIDPRLMIDQTWRPMMSALPAIKIPSARAGAAVEIANTTRSRRIRHGYFFLAAAALALAACTGGAGLDIPVTPVDHDCPAGVRCRGQ